jgi:hypothetical protein
LRHDHDRVTETLLTLALSRTTPTMAHQGQ